MRSTPSLRPGFTFESRAHGRAMFWRQFYPSLRCAYSRAMFKRKIPSFLSRTNFCARLKRAFYPSGIRRSVPAVQGIRQITPAFPRKTNRPPFPKLPLAFRNLHENRNSGREPDLRKRPNPATTMIFSGLGIANMAADPPSKIIGLPNISNCPGFRAVQRVNESRAHTSKREAKRVNVNSLLELSVMETFPQSPALAQ